MVHQINSRRLVYLEAEKLASDLAITSGKRPGFLMEPMLKGVLKPDEVEQAIRRLHRLSVDDYIRLTVFPSENPKRKSAPEVIRQLGGRIIHEVSDGPLFLAEIEFTTGDRKRRLLFLAQNRKSRNGVWMPHHHTRAADMVRYYSSLGMPVVTFIDTPGADAGEEANRNNQAHSISELIFEMANLQLPTVGVVFGNGYSGGAIPLATTNVLLSVRDGVFNTIHPMGLAEIAYNYNLSWQECAKYMGVSSYELFQRGYLDGVVDYSPLESHPPAALLQAIFTAVEAVETNAEEWLRDPVNDYFFHHYQESIHRYLNPSELLIEENRISDKTPTGMLNVFGSVYRFHRYQKLRMRLSSQSSLRHSHTDPQSMPGGELQNRLERDRKDRFNRWLEAPLEVRYNDELSHRYKKFLDTRKGLGSERHPIASFFMGRPEDNFNKATRKLTRSMALHLYNFWKEAARDNLVTLLSHLELKSELEPAPLPEADLIDILRLKPVADRFPWEAKNLVLFDLLYNKLIDNLPMIARELKQNNAISQPSMESLMEKVFVDAVASYHGIFEGESEDEVRREFFTWLESFISQRNAEKLMRQVSEWKRSVFPRLSEPLFGLVSYYFSTLMPALYAAQRGEKRFDGRINPRNIGIKDFWNRLNQAYDDLLIQNLLAEIKKTNSIPPRKILDSLFSNFRELNGHLMTSDPVRFPGFRQSIDRALENSIPPVGVITGLADFTPEGSKALETTRVGVVISNTQFQAGAFDMASGEKVCKLLAECAASRLPVVMFISSGGMQTKEGAGALFSMAVINDRITRFVKDNDLPVICFGFRDCTGGAQASFVTHRLVKTFYLSGAVIPFAGQRVVPSHLPAQAILANYLSAKPGAMDGLTVNPFDSGIDDRLREIDPAIPVAQETIHQAIARILKGEYKTPEVKGRKEKIPPEVIFAPVKKVLIHARGCTAARLVEGAHTAGARVVLVQSDADMESHPAELLRDGDHLVCLGGNTPQESYLNGMSVIRIAEKEEVDSIHPGIGFLSENPDFAKRCRRHGFNFIGPSHLSMEMMGNKSNAIATARRLKVTVVPGSHGVVTDPERAKAIADEIGYPVLIKAAFGGGGKGMRVVGKSEDFLKSFQATTQEAFGAFGNGDVYLEKFVESMRHVEAQVMRDGKGNTRILGYRDCSVQRDNQKLVEESASYQFTQEKVDEITRHATKLADDVNYVGAGTIEFIYDRVNDAFYFMEMNTRLQVEHPVTEMVCGYDIVALQFAIAQGKSIADVKPQVNGYAMEVRINAEKMEIQADGKVGFTPAPGKISRMVLPEDKRVRVIQAVKEGKQIPPYYDSMVMQVIAHGKDREDAVEILLAWMDKLVLEGVYTNTALMMAILKDPVFRQGDYDTGFLKGFWGRASLTAIRQEMERRSGATSVAIDKNAILIEGSRELKVLAPRTGVFYASPSPDEPPFVEIGAEFEAAKPLCLMEAMKVFDSVSLADFNKAGVVLYDPAVKYKLARRMAEPGKTVNQGDLLFVVEPVG